MMIDRDRERDDYEPLAWVRGVPFYAATLLALSHVAALGVELTLAALGRGGVVSALAFSSAAAREGALWQWVTYPWVHLPLGSPVGVLFLALELFLFYSFGREVEKYLGRTRFLALYGLLVLAPPMVLTLLGPVFPGVLEGSGSIHFAVFVAFAVLYPGVEFFFRFTARWVAAGLVALFALLSLAAGRWDHLAALLLDVGVVCGFIAYLRGTLRLPRWRFARRARRPAPVAEAPRPRGKPGREDDPVAEIDPLLDKISREGMASLTPKELRRLEEARERLLKQPRR